jgi:hypothetical protein
MKGKFSSKSRSARLLEGWRASSDKGDGREEGAARSVHPLAGRVATQEGSPMYQPSSLANRRNPSAARDARVTYWATAMPEV